MSTVQLEIPVVDDSKLDKTGKTFVHELREALKNYPLEVINGLAKAPEDDAVQQKMRDELSELSTTVSFLKNKFESVKTSLHIIDSKNIFKLDANGNVTSVVMDKLEPRWDVHRKVRRPSFFPLCLHITSLISAFFKTFTDLIDQSQESARKGALNCRSSCSLLPFFAWYLLCVAFLSL